MVAGAAVTDKSRAAVRYRTIVSIHMPQVLYGPFKRIAWRRVQSATFQGRWAHVRVGFRRERS
jgi:hypothetical protein